MGNQIGRVNDQYVNTAKLKGQLADRSTGAWVPIQIGECLLTPLVGQPPQAADPLSSGSSRSMVGSSGLFPISTRREVTLPQRQTL